MQETLTRPESRTVRQYLIGDNFSEFSIGISFHKPVVYVHITKTLHCKQDI